MKDNFKPYYAVIFTSINTQVNNEDYSKMAISMENLVKQQNGFIGLDSARNEIGITVSYWKTIDAIKNWKQETNHLFAQQKGKEDWYKWYKVRICKVEREYEFSK